MWLSINYKNAIICASLYLCLCFAGTASAQALQPCPNGMPAGSGCVPPSSSGGGASGSLPRPSQSWEDRYGALAFDTNTVVLGIAENKTSKRQARRTALEKCGTNNCKIVTEVVNACSAAAYNGQWMTYGWSGLEDEAKSIALAKCEKYGRRCQIEYSGCSLPVRVG